MHPFLGGVFHVVVARAGLLKLPGGREQDVVRIGRKLTKVAPIESGSGAISVKKSSSFLPLYFGTPELKMYLELPFSAFALGLRIFGDW